MSAYGIQSPDGEVLSISKELRQYCQKKGYPVAELDELDEWEEEDEYTSSEEESTNETENENNIDSSSSKELSENDMTDGEDIIEEEK